MFIDLCQSLICINQREQVKKSGLVRKGKQYELFNKCTGCGTRWKKPTLRCPCCGYYLRRSQRRKVYPKRTEY